MASLPPVDAFSSADTSPDGDSHVIATDGADLGSGPGSGCDSDTALVPASSLHSEDDAHMDMDAESETTLILGAVLYDENQVSDLSSCESEMAPAESPSRRPQLRRGFACADLDPAADAHLASPPSPAMSCPDGDAAAGPMPHDSDDPDVDMASGGSDHDSQPGYDDPDPDSCNESTESESTSHCSHWSEIQNRLFPPPQPGRPDPTVTGDGQILVVHFVSISSAAIAIDLTGRASPTRRNRAWHRVLVYRR